MIQKLIGLLHKYLIDGNRQPWIEANLFIYHSTDGQLITIKDEYKTSDLRVASLVIPRGFRREKLDDIQEMLGLLRKESKVNDPWNYIQYQCTKNTEGTLMISWNEELEIEHRGSIIGEKEIKHQTTNTPMIRRNPNSEESLRPEYFITQPKIEIQNLIHAMIKEGSELELEDYEEINFSQDVWQNIENYINDGISTGTEVKVKLDGKWDESSSKYSTIIVIVYQDDMLKEFEVDNV